MKRRWYWPTGLLVAASVLFGGCVPFGEPQDPPRFGSIAEAEGLARHWLNGLGGGTEDRGWSLLHPLSKERLFGDEESAYIDEVESIDWSNFRWGLEPPTVWDGNYRVTITIDGDAAPADLLADGHLIQLFGSDEGERGSITVRIDADGTAGILGP